MPNIEIPRAPETEDELWWLLYAMFGVKLPREKVCDDHVSPFDAVAHAFFAREPNYAVWYASRGSGKSLALALLGLAKSMILDVNVTILGGSMTQSQNVAAHMRDLLEFENAPVHALKGGSVDKGVTATKINLATGKWIRPIPASETTVRGPHPPLQLLDEIDEMDLKIYDSSMGQAMPQENIHGDIIPEYIVASSTWQNPEGTMTEVIERARKKGLPIFTWCWRELLRTPTNPTGWMTKRQIQAKRQVVSAQMWHTEYELNEPSGASRAFDLDKIEEYFVDYPDPIHQIDKGEHEQHWTWEKYEASGLYAVGTDWGKENDYTVIAVARYDVKPYRLVKLIKINKRPYPIMIGMMNREVEAYQAVGVHDKTGLGTVTEDYVDSEEVEGFSMVGRPRTQMLLSYITAFEHGDWRLPKAKNPEDELGRLKRGHRATTVADVYAPGKWDSHLPDVTAAMGLCHRAIERQGIPAAAQGVPKDGTGPKQFRGLERPKSDDGSLVRRDGVVTVVDERYDNVAVFSLAADTVEESWFEPMDA